MVFFPRVKEEEKEKKKAKPTSLFRISFAGFEIIESAEAELGDTGMKKKEKKEKIIRTRRPISFEA